MDSIWKFLVIGIAAGFVGGLLGLGGGIILVPVFILLLNRDQHIANGTSLMVIAPLSLIGSATYALGGNLNINIALWIAVGGMLGAYLGAQAANLLSSEKLKVIYSAFLLLVAIKMILG